MIGLVLPLLLAVAGVGTAFFTYRGIRRGGARYYTLERESLLRQASLTLLISTLLFLGAIGLMIYDQQLLLAEDAETAVVDETDPAASSAPAQAEETPELITLPPLPTETSTPGPTLSPTPLICRAVVEGTFDNGLTLRDNPGGGEVDILAESSIITVIVAEEPVEFNGFRWRKVRSLLGDEGWVAEDFITLGTGCE